MSSVRALGLASALRYRVAAKQEIIGSAGLMGLSPTEVIG